MITGNKSVQVIYNPSYNKSTNLNYKKCLQTSFTLQTSEFKRSGKLFRVKNKLQNNTIDNIADKDELHTLPTDVWLTCPYFTAKTGPTRPTNPEEVVNRSTRHRSLRSPPERILLKIYGNNKPEYSNTQQDLPDHGYT